MGAAPAIVTGVVVIAALGIAAWFVTQQQKARQPTSAQLIGGGAGSLITGILGAAGVH